MDMDGSVGRSVGRWRGEVELLKVTRRRRRPIYEVKLKMMKGQQPPSLPLASLPRSLSATVADAAAPADVAPAGLYAKMSDVQTQETE